MDKVFKCLLQMCVYSCISLCIMGAYHVTVQKKMHKIVVVDLERVIKEGMITIAYQELDEVNQKTAVQTYSSTLKTLFKELALEHKIVLVKDVVLNEAEDVTPWILEQLYAKGQLGKPAQK